MDGYWLLNPDAPGVIIWLILVYLWWSGGWQVATHAFDLEGRERLLVGFGLGLGLYLFSANLLARIFPPLLNFILSAGVVRLIALIFQIRQKNTRADRRDLRVWPLLLAGAVLGWVFLRVSQGLAIFDDYVHLPLISTMAAGNIPPRYFVNSEVNFAYHYGFHLFGASLMRLIGLAPWAAFDLSKAILWPYTILLAWLLGHRITGKRWGGVTFSVLVVFTSGTRYLLLLLPARLLLQMDSLVNFQGAETSLGGTFVESLLQTWPLDGGPAYSFPFAFISGIGRPLAMAHAGLNILNVAFLLLVWLIITRSRRRLTFLALAPLLALWGLTWETSFVLFLGGLFLTGGVIYWREKNIPAGPLRQALIAAVVAGVFTLVQGGLITEIAANFLSGSGGGSAGFGLRWPPAIVSAQLGPLPITSPYGLLLTFFELGPLILFTPWITVWAWKKFQEGAWLYAALILSAWTGFFIPIFMTYQSETDIARISEHAILVWALLLAALIWEQAGSGSKLFQYAAGLSLGLMVFGGMVLFGIGLTAAPYGILSYEFDPLDAQVQQATWDRLPPDSLVFDSRSWRASTLTGRLTNAVTGDLSFGNVDSPDWEALRASPTLAGFHAGGYDFVYISPGWWGKIPESGRAALSDPCITTVAAFEDPVTGQFRRLVDLRECASP